MTEQEIREIFQETYEYASENTSCLKVPVGACFVTIDGDKYFTSNHTNNGLDGNCIYNGTCYKAKVTGIYESCEETRKYCQATHAEVNMINLLEKDNSIPILGGVLFVSRYPCLGCAKKLVESGIDTVYYCGKVEISDEVKELFSSNNIAYQHFPDIDFEY